MADVAVSLQSAAGRISGWFAARPTWLKVLVVLLGWPLLLAARIAQAGGQAAVAAALAVALIGQPLWLQTLSPSGSPSPEQTAAPEADEPASEEPEPASEPAPVEDTGPDNDETNAEGDGADTGTQASEPEPESEPATTAPADSPDEAADEPASEEPASEEPEAQNEAEEPVAPQSPQQPASDGATRVADLLASLTTAAERRTGYDRDLFDHWVDADGNGCDAREEVLIAESTTPATTGSACRVTGGSWFSFYDATWVYESSSLDIDHMVPLAEAWDSGAHSWDASTRRAFANDLDEPRALIAVTAGSNRSKSDRDPAEWMPPDRGYWCVYVADWVVVKHRWQLSVDAAERAALERYVAGCGDLTVDAGAQVTPGTAPPPPPEPEPTPAPGEDTASDGEIRVFANCTEMRAVYPNGVAREDAAGNMVSGELRPLPSGVVVDTVLYEANRARDGDKDGIACE